MRTTNGSMIESVMLEQIMGAQSFEESPPRASAVRIILGVRLKRKN